MSNYAQTHHADSGSDLDDIDSESATLVEGAGRSLNIGLHASRSHASQHASGSAIANAYAAVSARLEKLPLCCCKLTPFKVFIFLLFAVGFAMLIPGILMRLESVVSPSPLLLFNLCRQPSSWSAGTLEKFRQEVGRKESREGKELRYEGISLSTSALSVYRGSEKYQCAEEDAYEGSAQVIDLPDTLLYTGVTYVAFLSLPTYVVGGNVAMRLYSGNHLLFNITTSLHLHRYLGAHEIVWLEAAHERDEVTRVYNPHLPPPQKHAHGVREEDCRFPTGCPYRLRAGMQSLILTSTAFKIDTPVVLTEEQRQREEHARASAEMYQEIDAQDQHHHLEVASAVVQPQQRTFAQDESMLIYATGLKLVLDYAEVVESNELASRANAHVPGEDQPHVYDPDGHHERQSPMTFIAPDILLSFHQYELSPMQHVGVAYIIRGSILLLAAIAIAFVKYSNDQARSIKQR